jgi:hypothetical protein
MSRLARFVGVAILGVALTVGVGVSQDKKDKDTGKETKDKLPPLPPGWKALKLDKSQRVQLGTVMVEYKHKISELEKKIDDLKAAEKQAMLKVLTDEQRAQYLKGLTGDDFKEKQPPPKDK